MLYSQCEVHMIIGIPKELKSDENRVSVTPFGALELNHCGNSVLIESGAGIGSGYSDQLYERAGCRIVEHVDELFEKSDIIVKVKEPMSHEVAKLRKDQILFTYLHLASSRSLTENLMATGCVAIAYETIEDARGTLPLLFPMSQIAGRLSVQVGAYYLMHHMGGNGTLLGGVPGVEKGRVVILGGGTVGTEAAKMAAGIGAKVTILDIDQNRLTYLSEILPGNVETLYSNSETITASIMKADLVIGAVLVPGAKAPVLVSKDLVSKMKAGSVIVDVAVDQGGCIETSLVTTHSEPIHMVDHVLHYGVANMPGAVPRSSTQALTALTLPYLKKLTKVGWKSMCELDAGFRHGINIVNKQVVYRNIAEQFSIPLGTIDELE